MLCSFSPWYSGGDFSLMLSITSFRIQPSKLNDNRIICVRAITGIQITEKTYSVWLDNFLQIGHSLSVNAQICILPAVKRIFNNLCISLLLVMKDRNLNLKVVILPFYRRYCNCLHCLGIYQLSNIHVEYCYQFAWVFTNRSEEDSCSFSLYPQTLA